LQELRKKQGISRERLAADIGCSYHTIVAIENGLRKPSLEIAAKIAYYLGSTVDRIFCAQMTYKKSVRA